MVRKNRKQLKWESKTKVITHPRASQPNAEHPTRHLTSESTHQSHSAKNESAQCQINDIVQGAFPHQGGGTVSELEGQLKQTGAKISQMVLPKIQQLQQQILPHHHQFKESQIQSQESAYSQESDQQSPQPVESPKFLPSPPPLETVLQGESKLPLTSQQSSTILERLSRTTPWLRLEQQKKILNFLHSQSDMALYIAGVTGSGKTTTVLHVLQQMVDPPEYTLINCLSQMPRRSDPQLPLCVSFCPPPTHLILDQCDALPSLSSTLAQLREQLPYTKLLLLSNNSCQEEMPQKESIPSLFFLPYSKEELQAILSYKLGDAQDVVPMAIKVEGVRRALGASGDFRELQKYIRGWVQGYMAGTRAEQSEIVLDIASKNLKASILQKMLLTGGVNRSLILHSIVKSAMKIQKKQKKTECKCKETMITKLKSQVQSIAKAQQVLFYLQQWAESGILQIQASRCHLHNRCIEASIIKIVWDLQLLADVLKKVFLVLGV